MVPQQRINGQKNKNPPQRWAEAGKCRQFARLWWPRARNVATAAPRKAGITFPHGIGVGKICRNAGLIITLPPHALAAPASADHDPMPAAVGRRRSLLWLADSAPFATPMKNNAARCADQLPPTPCSTRCEQRISTPRKIGN